MRKFAKCSFLALALALATCTAAHARPAHCDPPNPDPTPSAPEVDPGFAMGGFSLLAGALTLLRTRTVK
jgi:hypothetical protein